MRLQFAAAESGEARAVGVAAHVADQGQTVRRAVRVRCDGHQMCGERRMKAVQEMLGHSSITITMDICASVLPELAKEAAAKLVPRNPAV
ncbi:hypothetical protein Scani_71720 [Streptomyces caniferus]|uniref:Tyr recombinase domain-containing protein n=1 Tax=Streptomyces caniferus TaxID=285557 RepID=A0A640SJ96_9ACTN|nr:hypothetical protein Scani_71720 [Streptomyces caniferus]